MLRRIVIVDFISLPSMPFDIYGRWHRQINLPSYSYLFPENPSSFNERVSATSSVVDFMLKNHSDVVQLKFLVK